MPSWGVGLVGRGRVFKFSALNGNANRYFFGSFALYFSVFFRPSASVFSLRAQRKGTKRKGTLASAYFLRCSSAWASNETRPSGLHTAQATAELEQTLADPSHADCATRRVR
jgi:hypothetical protein